MNNTKPQQVVVRVLGSPARVIDELDLYLCLISWYKASPRIHTASGKVPMSAPKRSLGSESPGTTDSLDSEGREPDPHPVLWFRENTIPITGLILFILFLSLI